MSGGAAYFTFLELGLEPSLRVGRISPLDAGLSFWPQVAAVVLAAIVLGVLFKTRWLPVLVLIGMVLLMGGGGLLLTLPLHAARSALMLSAPALLGLAAGWTVSPGLFIAGLALPAQLIGTTFGAVELVRSEADYIMAPVLLKVAKVASGPGGLNAAGVFEATWITLAITGASVIVGLVLFLLSGAPLPRPDLEAWLKHNRVAIGSPKLAERVRDKS
jgi:hypothetical protein